MLNKNYTRQLLGLEDVLVKNIDDQEETIHIYIQMEKRIHRCPGCNNPTSKVHDYHLQQVKDIPTFGKQTVLHLRKRRHICPVCGKKFYETVSFLPRYHRMTSRLFAYLICELKQLQPMKAVADRIGISITTVMRIFDHIHYARPKLPRILSIDEFKGNAGGNKFQSILADPENRLVLDILPDRKLEHLCHYFAGFENRKAVECVVMDMSTLFRSMAQACFPKAKIIADKFHVQRQVTWALENVRKRVQKQLSKQMRKYFKRSRWLLLKDSTKLTEEDLTRLEILLGISEDLRHAYKVKCEFRTFMDCTNRNTARKELSKWITFTQTYDLPEFENCCQTFINWRVEILNYFSYNYTNGFTEGTNNKIKVLKRNAFGVQNFQRFRNRILLTTS